MLVYLLFYLKELQKEGETEIVFHLLEVGAPSSPAH